MRITNLAQLKKLPTGTEIYLQNHANPHRSRHTRVFKNYSFFFSVEKDGKESHIFDSKNCPKANQFIFKDGKVDIFSKDGSPYLTIYTDQNYINTFPKQ